VGCFSRFSNSFFSFAILLAILLPGLSWAADEHVPTRYGMGGNFGLVYDPGGNYDFVQVNGFALFDYDAVWPHRAPEALRFKVEANAGVTVEPRVRAIVSANMLALYYFDGLRTATFRPYGEAGIGLIYTDFQVDGQGLRVNFNPQLGIGAEIERGGGPPWFAALRLHHISNAGLHKDNRGINSLVFQVGFYFQ
jgi:lipid A 3-O-deacylase